MPQDPNDPRVRDYYRNQRQQAELGAAKGNQSATATLEKITGKLARGGGKRSQVEREREIIGGGRGHDAAVAMPVDRDPAALLGGALVDVPGILADLGVNAARGAAGVAGRAVEEGMGHGLFPRAAEAPLAQRVGKALKTRSTQPAQRDLPARQVMPRAVSAKLDPRKLSSGTRSLPDSGARRALPAPQKAVAGSPKRAALPAPKEKLPAGYKQPKTVKAGTPRATQSSPRAKGTNARARAKSGGKQPTDGRDGA